MGWGFQASHGRVLLLAGRLPHAKSQMGLIQSLLYEIIRQCPDLIPTILPARWEAYVTFGADLHPWTLPELLDAFTSLSNNPPKDVTFCFFIDGLDEYKGRPQDLVKLLDTISLLSNTKICASSRPWNVFKDAFKAAPSLLLEDLTRPDIQHYVDSQLNKNSLFRRIAAAEKVRATKLIDEVVSKATGVFLWVFLVVRSLLEGICDGDRISDLENRLQQLPAELEDLFVTMLKGTNDLYFSQAGRLFRLVLEAPQPPTLLTLSYCDEDDPETLRMIQGPLSREEVVSRCDSMSRRLASRTQGLVESRSLVRLTDCWTAEHDIDMSTPGVISEDVDTEVHFLHRTVRDFLQTPTTKIDFLAEVDMTFNPLSRLLEAYIARIRGMNLSGRSSKVNKDLWKFVQPAISCAKLIELRYESSPTDLLHQLDEAASTVYSKAIVKMSGASHWSNTRPSVTGGVSSYDPPWTSFLTYAIELGLLIFVRDELCLRQTTEWDKTGPPLLYFAFADAKTSPSLVTGLEGMPCPNAEMVRLLLELGADPNRYYSGCTVWESLVKAAKPMALRLAVEPPEPQEGPLVTACRLFIEHGADLSVRKKPLDDDSDGITGW